MNKGWNKTDNSMEFEKAEMRKKNLPDKPRVLDLFCGKGEMYKRAYTGVCEYLGLDIEKVHNNEICKICNNAEYVLCNDITKYNVFDLDAYGAPWELFYLITKKINPGDYTFFITDGLVMHQKVDGTVTSFVSGTEKIPKGMNLPGINRFYVDIFGTMLLDVEKRYNAKVKKAIYFHNKKRTVYYWTVKLRKNEE